MLVNKKKIVMLDEEHKAYHRRLIYIATILLLLLLGGATFYHFYEKWRYLDSLYFTTATMTTIGYGDFSPKTDGGKIFTIFFAFFSVGLALYGMSLIAGHFVEMREEFWLQRIGQIKIKERTTTFWSKLKRALYFDSEKLTKDEEKK